MKRFVSILFALALAVCLLSTVASAEETAYVALVGDTCYTDMQDALNAASKLSVSSDTNVTVTMTADLEIDFPLGITGGSITLDMDGHTIRATEDLYREEDLLYPVLVVCDVDLTITGNGRIESPPALAEYNNDIVILVFSYRAHTTLTMLNGSIVTHCDAENDVDYFGIVAQNDVSLILGDAATGEGPTIDGGYSPVAVTGLDSDVTICGGTYIAHATTSYDGSCVIAYTGTEIAISGGDFYGYYCLAAWNTIYPEETLLLDADITGGNFYSACSLLLVDTEANGDTLPGEVTVALEISGGCFVDAGAEEYFTEDSQARLFAARVGNTYYPTVAEAVAAANGAGEAVTVKMLTDDTLTEPVVITGTVTLDMDGHTLWIDPGIEALEAIYVIGDLTITGDGTICMRDVSESDETIWYVIGVDGEASESGEASLTYVNGTLEVNTHDPENWGVYGIYLYGGRTTAVLGDAETGEGPTLYVPWYCLCLYEGSHITINSGSYESYLPGTLISYYPINATLTINGGTFAGRRLAVLDVDHADYDISRELVDPENFLISINGGTFRITEALAGTYAYSETEDDYYWDFYDEDAYDLTPWIVINGGDFGELDVSRYLPGSDDDKDDTTTDNTTDNTTDSATDNTAGSATDNSTGSTADTAADNTTGSTVSTDNPKTGDRAPIVSTALALLLSVTATAVVTKKQRQLR